MNKFIRNLTAAAVVGVLAFGLHSCKKRDETTVTKTIDVQLAINESYSLPLDAGDADDLYVITTAATHQKVSAISGSAQAAPVYNYTPAQDYKGKDNVVLALQENHPGRNGDTRSEIIYNINITVGGASGN